MIDQNDAPAASTNAVNNNFCTVQIGILQEMIEKKYIVSRGYLVINSWCIASPKKELQQIHY